MGVSTSVTGPGSGPMVLIPRLARQILRRSDETLLGMPLRDLMTLTYLRDHDGVPQQNLADVMCMDSNNVVLMLNELEDRGHLTRRRDPDDRRRHRVQITPAGRRATETAEHAHHEVENDVLGTLSTAERDTLRGLLTRIVHTTEPSE